ncbi:MAG: MFS transporter, partial [Novosphingobium sp.]|nr:MFS transporter [Novosphingobium sp.]
MTLTASADRPHWGQVAIAAVAQNFASGLCFGSFGTMILAIEREYSASRSESSMALSLSVVSLCVTAMLVGRIIHRVELRSLFIAGALTSAAGFGAASIASGPNQLLL